MARSNDPDDQQRKGHEVSQCSDMSMMRIAVAGTGGLARFIAHYIEEDTFHHVVFLSRNARRPLVALQRHLESQQPQLTSAGYQVAVVDYAEIETLQFALRGIDTVISTVTGINQIELIKAAVSVHVRRFAPAEFEGLPSSRSAQDPLDRGRTSARQWLTQFSDRIESTSFICGILYERFQPGGLARSGIGNFPGLGGEGDYILNCRDMTAQVPAYGRDNRPDATICMTAAQDVARFVCRALDLRRWPSELRMYGHRIQVKDLMIQVQRLRGSEFINVQWHGPATLRSDLQVAITQNDPARQIRLRALINTAEGCYDFTEPNLNQHFRDIRTIDFETWFNAQWPLQA